MIEEEDEQLENGDDQDLIQRIEYLDVRVATQIERLESRVRGLESQIRLMNESGDADFRRLHKLGARVFSRRKPDPNGLDDTTSLPKRFPVTMRQTSVGLLVVTGMVTGIISNNDSVSGARLLGRWFGVFLFCAGLPGILAYAIAGRKQEWSKNDQWFFWGFAITALWTVILAIQTVS